MRLGIDFGTCFSSAAFVEDDVLHLVKDTGSLGFSVPSSVFVNAQGQIIVGKNANNMRLRDPARYRRDLKRDLGKAQPFVFGNQEYLPEVLISRVLAKIKSDADTVVQNMRLPAFTGAVLTIPATYQEHKRNLMRSAAVRAGFLEGEITLLEEPFAAALYYEKRNPLSEGEILLVYDLGGGTFDTALLQKRGETFEYLAAPAGIERCGGIDFDRAIYNYLIQQHQEIRDILQSGREDKAALLARSMIGDICIEIKHQLSDLQEVDHPLVIPGLASFIECHITRANFNQMIVPAIQETVNCSQKMLQRASITAKQVSRILLVGGSCRIPYVQQMLRQSFKCQINAAPDLELVVCQGAALYADQHAITTVSSDGRGTYAAISEAIEDVEPNSQIIVYPGVYEENIIIDKDVEVIGSGPREQIIIKSTDDPCVDIQTEHAVLRGLTLIQEDNYSTAVLQVSQGKLILESCALIVNEADTDDAIGLLVEDDGEAYVRKCVISILDEEGVGIDIKQDGTVTVDDSEIYGNFALKVGMMPDTSFEGVGIRLGDGSLALRNCKFHHLGAGAVIDSEGTLTLEDCEVYECGVGLGMDSGGELSAQRCTMRDNVFGIFVNDETTGQGKIEDCEISCPTFSKQPIEYDEDGDPTFFSVGLALGGGSFLIQRCNIHDCHFDIISGEYDPSIKKK